MLEIKVTIALEDETKSLIGKLLTLVETGHLGNFNPSRPTETSTKPAKKASAAETPTTGETPAETTSEPQSPKKQPITTPKQTPAEKSYDIEDIRALLADAKHAHGIDTVKALLRKYGAESGKLADVPAAQYGALAADIAKIGE